MNNKLEYKLSASILAIYLDNNFISKCKDVIDYGVEWIHLDFMDGCFVDNNTFDCSFIQNISKNLPNIFLDTHLMSLNPEKYILDMKKSGVNLFNFHIETVDEKLKLIKLIKKYNMLVGISLKPATSLDKIIELCESDNIYLINIMLVEPGKGGQKIIKDMLKKIKLLRKYFPNLNIQVDGGINHDNIIEIKESGANIFVIGSAIFNSNNIENSILKFKSLLNNN